MDSPAWDCGRWTAMTAFAPVPRYWASWLRFYYRASRWLTVRGLFPAPRSLIELSMIGFARWSLIERLPAASRSRAARLPTPYLLFEVNFNGDSDQYLEAFALITPAGLRANWWGAYGFPNVRRVSRFQSYVNQRNLPPSYFYCAYPGASTKSIRIGLELEREIAGLASTAAGMSSQRFRDAYLELVTEAQRLRNPRPGAPAARATDALTVLTPVQVGSVDRLRRDLVALSEGTAPVPDGTHFARWVIVPRLEPGPGRPPDPTSYLLFSAWFDHAPHYVEALLDRLGVRAEAIWRHCGFEGGDAAALRRYLLAHRVEPSATFHAYDGVPVRHVREAVGSAQRFGAFAVRAQAMRPDELQAEWRRTFG